MNHDHFWLTEAQFARLEPFLPTDTRGKLRVDEERGAIGLSGLAPMIVVRIGAVIFGAGLAWLGISLSVKVPVKGDQ